MYSAYGAPKWDLSDRLNKALRHSGKSTQQMADELGVHRNTISNYTSGRKQPDRRTILAWAVATGVPVVWLETGEAADDQGPSGGGAEVGAGSAPRAALASLTAMKRSRVRGARDTDGYPAAA
jgi:transcriptional regulator with XRE-family HTH domain